ncbi:MAG: hypothetical protein SAK29_26210 [Scytonema sp. PMC 1069.18]|nr:hypothetical protein [Scytonema sp. PMC 1069.18]MEC4880705.1 hypothetical protein [Scytonema sp. PMC 1070.18]
MKEFYPSVTYYGIGEILKRYAKYPLFLPCPVAIQHGWSIIPTAHDARCDVPENWYWSHWLEDQYRQQFDSINTRSIGAPFLYLLKLMKYSEIPDSQRKGSIVFPCHSSKLIDVDCDFEEYADLLDKLPDEYKPITVCIYHLDRDKGLDKPFLKRGFKVVSNGNNLFETQFLTNFIANTHDKKYAFSNQMTSALLFASVMGLSSFFYGPEFRTKSEDPNYQNLDYTNHHRKWETKYNKYFKFPNCSLEEQRRIAARELGMELLLSPFEMRWLLWRLTLDRKYLKLLARKVIDSTKYQVKKTFPLLYKIHLLLKKNTDKYLVQS